jgi:chemotaxis-related protein WspD
MRNARQSVVPESTVAARLFDRALPPGYIEEWTRHFTAPAAAETTDTQSAFIFRIGADWLALASGAVEEVAEPRAIHSIPHRRGLVLGLVNIRGELLVCVSLAQLLGIEQAATGTDRWLLVLGGGTRRVVCPVDEIHGSYRHAEQDLIPQLATLAGDVYTRALLRWGDRTAGYLDGSLVALALERGLA